MDKTKEARKAFDQSLHYITFKNRTETEVSVHLEKKEYDEQVIAVVMAKLVDYGFVNDKTYLKNYCDNNLNYSYWGRIKMRYDLKRRGLREALLEMLEELYTEAQEKTCCEKQCHKALRQYEHENFLKKKSKLYAFLQRKGFSNSLIKEVISENLPQEEGTFSKEEMTDEMRSKEKDDLKRFYEKYRRTQENKGYTGRELKQRIIRNLMSRGYGYDLIRDYMEEVEEA